MLRGEVHRLKWIFIFIFKSGDIFVFVVVVVSAAVDENRIIINTRIGRTHAHRCCTIRYFGVVLFLFCCLCTSFVKHNAFVCGTSRFIVSGSGGRHGPVPASKHSDQPPYVR